MLTEQQLDEIGDIAKFTSLDVRRTATDTVLATRRQAVLPS